jgi:hypothetical protein
MYTCCCTIRSTAAPDAAIVAYLPSVAVRRTATAA